MTQDGGRAIAIGHLSDSGELKTLYYRKKIHLQQLLKSELKMLNLHAMSLLHTFLMQQFKHNQTHTYSNNSPKKELKFKGH